MSFTSLELDAIPPDQLRGLVQEAIELHLPPDQMRVLKEAEESERTLIRAWATYAVEQEALQQQSDFLR